MFAGISSYMGQDHSNTVRAWALVAVQLSALAYLALTGPVVSARASLLALEVAALVPGLWAVAVIRPWNLRITPTPHPRATLVTRGPYRWIRHPMYTSLLVLTAAWLADEFSAARGLVWCAFVANMVVKMAVEERHLARRFEQFDAYRRATWRVIPFVF